MIFYLTILNLSLYDVNYKCIRVKDHDQIFYLKKFIIFVHVHVRYVFKFNLENSKLKLHGR